MGKPLVERKINKKISINKFVEVNISTKTKLLIETQKIKKLIIKMAKKGRLLDLWV